jgi:2-dehydropantoate 2-reductase
VSVRVGILGPGAVGGVLAVRLVQAGTDVVCVARPATAEAITAKGLTLRHGSARTTIHVRAVSELEEQVELLLIAVKSPALDDALHRVASAGARMVIPLLNGIEHLDVIRDQLRDGVVAGSVGRIEAYRDSPTELVQTTAAVTVTLASGVDERSARVLTGAGIDVHVDGSDRAVLWEKLARQAPVAAATAATQRSIGELRTDPEWRRRLELAVLETCSVARAEGIELTPAAQWAIIDAMPPTLTSSTARDVAAGRPSELDAITGGAVRAGRQRGVPMPALELLLAEAEERCRLQSR